MFVVSGEYIHQLDVLEGNALISHTSCMRMSFERPPGFSITQRSNMSMELGTMSFGSSFCMMSFHDSLETFPFGISYDIYGLDAFQYPEIQYFTSFVIFDEVIIYFEFHHGSICRFLSLLFLELFFFSSDDSTYISVLFSGLVSDNLLRDQFHQSNRQKFIIDPHLGHFFFSYNKSSLGHEYIR